MKKLLAFAVATAVLAGTASVFAGEGCCASMSKSSIKGACSGDMFSKLNLTDAQKTQLEALKDSTKRATSTSEAHAMFNEGLERILTPEQLTQFKAQCDSAKAKAGGQCPFMKSQQKS
jgi:Spy/CpxP family protein refolding chaperone